MERRHRAGEPREEARGAALAVGADTAVPHRNLVDLEIGNGLHLLAHELWEEFRDEHLLSARGALAGGDEFLEALGFSGEDGLGTVRLGEELRFHPVGLGELHQLDPVGFGLLLGADRVGRSLLDAAETFGLGIGLDDLAFLRDFGGHDDVRELGRALAFGTLLLGALFGDVGLLEHLGLGDLFRGGGEALGFGLGAAALGVRIRDVDLGGVFTLGRLGIRVGNGDPFVALGHGRADFTVTVGLGDLHLRFGDGLRGGFLSKGVDVARCVGDVLHVHVDESQANLLQLDLDSGGNVRDELVAVGVDLLDVHRRDDDAHLAKDDVFREFSDVLHRETEEPLGGVLHYPGFRGDPHGEGRGRVDADVLLGKGALKFDVDRQGRQVEVLVILDDRPDEGRATVITLRRLACADLPVDDEDAVGGTLLVSCGESDEHKKEDRDNRTDEDEVFEHGGAGGWVSGKEWFDDEGGASDHFDDLDFGSRGNGGHALVEGFGDGKAALDHHLDLAARFPLRGNGEVNGGDLADGVLVVERAAALQTHHRAH